MAGQININSTNLLLFHFAIYRNEYGKEEYNKGIQKAKIAVIDMSAKMPNFSIVSDRTAEKSLYQPGYSNELQH